MSYPPPPVGEDEEEKPGDTYTGHMEHGKKNGSGKYVWSNGASYEGDYLANKKHGHGIMVFPDKSKYDGGSKQMQRALPAHLRLHRTICYCCKLCMRLVTGG